MNDIRSYGRAAVDAVEHAVDDVSNETVRQSLGWVSVGIGLAELAAPERITKMMGVEGAQSEGIVRTLGVRELMHGVDLLSHKDPTPGAWGRVAGDMLDGVLLGVAATRTRRTGGWLAIAAAVLPVVLADMVFAPHLSRKKARRWF